VTLTLDFLKVKEELKNKVHPKGVDFVFLLLSDFIYNIQSQTEASSTLDLVKALPRLAVNISGYLADVHLEKYSITTYQVIGEVLDACINQGIFKYGKFDSLDHFNISPTLLDDVKSEMVSKYKTLKL
jgi:uncharacterized repeat protein (TIGR04138 family)